MFLIYCFSYNVFGYDLSSNSFEVSPQKIQRDLNSIINMSYSRLNELEKYKEQNGGYVYVGDFGDNIHLYIYTKNDIYVDKLTILCKYNNDMAFEKLSKFEYYISNIIDLVDSTLTYTDVWKQLNFDDVYNIGTKYFQNNNINYIYYVNKNNISLTISPEDIELKNSNDNINLLINGNKINSDVSPQVISGIMMIPLRNVFQGLGADVEWNQGNKEIVIYRLDTVIRLKPEYENVFVNNDMIRIEAMPKIIDNNLMVPLSFVSQVIECDINYDNLTNTVIINNK